MSALVVEPGELGNIILVESLRSVHEELEVGSAGSVKMRHQSQLFLTRMIDMRM